MDFSLTEEQTVLRDSINKYISNDYPFDARRALAADDRGYSLEHWRSFAELGWLTIPFAEALGGYGGRLEDVAVLMEQFGAGLVREPYLPSVLLAGQLIARSGHREAMDEILPLIMDGSHQGALAAAERQSGQNLYDVKTTATQRADGFHVHGHKVMVNNGANADTLIITARTSGAQDDKNGVSLFLLDAKTPGISVTAIPMMDGSRYANIELNDVVLPEHALIGTINDASTLFDGVIREARVAICAEALGVMEMLFHKTVDYTKSRQQFGVAISSFQALQHRMVDMFMAKEQARSIVYRAICECQQNEPTADATVAAMKSLVGKHARQIGSEAIQMHGGMGMTDELDIGHYVKRGMMLNLELGDIDASLREFCDLTYAA